MSRIVVKSLPPRITEEELRNLFGTKGLITDVQLKYTKDGIFRHFAFIGFKKEEEAKAAKDYYNNTYVKSFKIQVEMCAPLGDTSKPRAWSRYAKDSSAYQKKVAKDEKESQVVDLVKEHSKRKGTQVKEKTKDETLLAELQSDPQFAEFVEVHKKKGTKPSWTDNTGHHLVEVERHSKEKVEMKEVCFDDSASGSESDEEEEEDAKENESDCSNGSSVDLSKISKIISDADYLKSKVVKSIEEEESFGEENSEQNSSDADDEKNVDEKPTKKKSKRKSTDSAEETPETNSSGSDSDAEEDSSKAPRVTSRESSPIRDNTFTVKLRNLPWKCKKKQIKAFFRPLKIISLRLPPRVKGISYVKFKTEKEFRQALNKHKSFLTGHQIEVIKYEPSAKSASDPTVMDEKTLKWKKNEEEIEKDETVAESGRLFIRNLPYTTTEEELEKHFSKYGPLAEVNLPIDRLTRMVKGFAFVTFVMPEHAVKAYTEEDGKVFQGRMLHILPGKTKKTDDSELSDAMTFKQKKNAKQKKQSSSTHNWNTLFLGADAVADAMAARYKTTKSHILNAETSQSIAVRIALGETQLVSETRNFLLENGVSLDAFSQPASQRSKTVILVKNLPANTSPEDLKEIFAKHGELGRIILPPQGITAIVEFLEPSEARTAFRKLAYTKFQHIPLYLEWAPVSTFTNEPTAQKTNELKEESKNEEEHQKVADLDDEEDDDEPEPNTTLFVKNVNFATTDEALKKHFEKCGRVYLASVSKKKDLKNPGQMLSMGYGFVQYKNHASAVKALKDLQRSKLDEHSLELKTSNKVLHTSSGVARKKTKTTVPQNSTKILVRNIPFQAKTDEIRDLFSTFGELKVVRLPRKLSGSGTHRGFGFVDFLTKHDAKRAFKALCHSTHLYGRRLVLEWANTDETVEGLRKKTAHHFHEGPAPVKKRPKSSADVAGLLAAVDSHSKEDEDSD